MDPFGDISARRGGNSPTVIRFPEWTTAFDGKIEKQRQVKKSKEPQQKANKQANKTSLIGED